MLEWLIVFFLLFGTAYAVRLIEALTRWFFLGDTAALFTVITINPIILADLSIASPFYMFGIIQIVLWYLIFLIGISKLTKLLTKTALPFLDNFKKEFLFNLTVSFFILFCMGNGIPNFLFFIFFRFPVIGITLSIAFIFFASYTIIEYLIKKQGKKKNDKKQKKQKEIIRKTLLNIKVMPEKQIEFLIKGMKATIDKELDYKKQHLDELIELLISQDVKKRDIKIYYDHAEISKLSMEIYRSLDFFYVVTTGI